MLKPEQKAEIRRLHHAEGWRVGTIARHLGVHHSAVTNALMGPLILKPVVDRVSQIKEFEAFMIATVEEYIDLSATRLHQMLASRGFKGSIYPVRRWLKKNRPKPTRVYQDLYFMPGESAQVDWADLGKLEIAPGISRRLQCFVMVLSYSRQIYAKVFYDQKTCALLEGHEAAFEYFGGVPRRIIYDNMRTAVVYNSGGGTQFTDSLCDLASHYNFSLTACPPRAAWHKGRVERAIRYIRDSFSPKTRDFKTVDELNSQLSEWMKSVSSKRPWPDDNNKTVYEAFKLEQGILIKLASAYPCYDETFVKVSKQSYVQFDCNSYTVPPKYVGQSITVRASSKTLNIYAEQELIAKHQRRWSKREKVCDIDHVRQIINATKSRPQYSNRNLIISRIPSGSKLLKCWAATDENLSKQSKAVGELIARYGMQAVEAAAQLALENETPRSDSIDHILRAGDVVPCFTRPKFKRSDLEQYTTDSHDLSIYDEL